MELCVLGSGSAGNCSALRINNKIILIDAGFGPRVTTKRLELAGESIDNVAAIILTHLDSDHFNTNWYNTLIKQRIRLYCHERHVKSLYRRPNPTPSANPRALHKQNLLYHFDDQAFRLPLETHPDHPTHTDRHPDRHPVIQPIRFAHDSTGTCGFVIRNQSTRLGYATDLGRITNELIQAMTDVDLLAIESNYDPTMQLTSDRPEALKHRIMNGAGHLANHEALQAVRDITDRSQRPPQHIVKLHLSRQCNDPAIVRRLYEPHPDLAPNLHISQQTEPTPWLPANKRPQPITGQQLTMFA